MKIISDSGDIEITVSSTRTGDNAWHNNVSGSFTDDQDLAAMDELAVQVEAARDTLTLLRTQLRARLS